MAVSRREFLKLLGILAASAGAAAGCRALPGFFPGEITRFSDLGPVSSLDWRALNRISFGPRFEDLQRLAEIGLGSYLEDQLSPASIPDLRTELLLSRFPVLELDADALRNRGDKLFDNYDPGLILDPFRQATTLRQVYSRRQLFEVMVEFWTDHFNISVQKGDCWFLKIVDDREVIRAHALGSFRSLLGASAHSPAMLVYLDNQENRRGTPNENYARELLELHTLGLDSGYTQADVMELARCLTGWRVKEHFWKGELAFDQDAHSPGSKQVLGVNVGPAGRAEIDQVLDILAIHPATARHISAKLARRFLADDPPVEIVERASQVFQDSGGDIGAVLRSILLDGLPGIQQNGFALKYKRPVNYLVSALRLTGAETNGGTTLQRYLKLMGQPLYDWPSPDGYPDTAAAWQGNLLPRWRFALELVQGGVQGTAVNLNQFLGSAQGMEPAGLIDQAAKRLLGAGLSPNLESELIRTLQPVLETNPRQAAELVIAAILASPAFQWR